MRGKQAQRKTACCLPTPRHPFRVALFPMIQLCATFAFQCILPCEKVCLVHISHAAIMKIRQLQWIRTHNIKECEECNTLYPIRAVWAVPILTPLHPEMQMEKAGFLHCYCSFTTREAKGKSISPPPQAPKVITERSNSHHPKRKITHPTTQGRTPSQIKPHRQQSCKNIFANFANIRIHPVLICKVRKRGQLNPTLLL